MKHSQLKRFPAADNELLFSESFFQPLLESVNIKSLGYIEIFFYLSINFRVRKRR
jgi:hypothetical protein